MKRIIPILLALLLLTSCAAPASEPERRDIFAMDTYMTITCQGAKAKAALDDAEAEIGRLDALLSVGNAKSEISRINASGSGTLSEDSRVMVEKSLELYKDTGGAFDITVFPLMQAWGFTDGNYRIPDSGELDRLLSITGADKLTYSDGNITLGEGQGIDLGAIAKGYTSQRLSDIFAGYNLDWAMISLGGNMQFYGKKADGTLWRCGIKDPFDSVNLMAILTVDDVAVVTSGGYERNFTGEDGNIYHHIIDPKTGRPADSGIVSTTIVSKSGTLADGLSTACYVMGLEKSSDYWRAHSDEFDMVLMTADGEIYITQGLDGKIETGYSLHVIER